VSGSPIKILVADDTQAERLVAREALTRAGYEVCEAFDGIHTLEVFARERPALVMIDVVMPKMTGIEACRILKARMQSDYLPVLMVSTKNTVNARVEGLRSGADDFLGSPTTWRSYSRGWRCSCEHVGVLGAKRMISHRRLRPRPR
jgi:two-component system, cell cycle response regulator